MSKNISSLARRRRFTLQSLAGLTALSGASSWPLARAAGTSHEPATTGPQFVRFALLGDNPYGPHDEAPFRRAIKDAGRDSAFLIHVGDFKGGIEYCGNELMEKRAALLEASERPLIFTPGDNEWTDCSRFAAGNFEPLERLHWLRQRFYAKAAPIAVNAPDESKEVSARLQFENQSQGTVLPYPATPADIRRIGLPENQRWRAGPARFVSLHVVGSKMGFNSGVPKAIVQAQAQACKQWLFQTAALASREASPVLVIVLHAEFNPRRISPQDFTSNEVDPKKPYAWFRRALYETVVGFDGAVVLLHGDNHRFTLDRPWREHVGKHLTRKLPSLGVARAERETRLRRFARVRIIGAPASSSWLQIEITHKPGADNPLELNVTPNSS